GQESLAEADLAALGLGVAFGHALVLAGSGLRRKPWAAEATAAYSAGDPALQNPMELAEELPGICPICDCQTTFKATGPWLRETLLCAPCRKRMGRPVPGERALALVLKKLRPNWRDLAIHESSPARRGVSEMLRRECRQYLASQYLPGRPLGQIVGGW